MKYEDVIEEIGGCGFYQKYILSALYLVAMLNGLQGTILILLVPNTNHRCAIPGWSNDTYEEQNEQHRKAIDTFIPQQMEDGTLQYSRCYIYANETLGNNQTLQKCNSWVYDKSVFQSSITTDMNLVCDRKEFKTYYMLAFYLGAFAATISCGWFADRFGRKPVIIATLMAQGISSIVISQMRSIEPILFLEIIASWGGSGVYFPSSVFGTEISSTTKRTFASVAIHIFFTIGCLLLPMLAYFIRTWRLLILIISLPCLPLALLYVWILPESPRWLLSIHKDKKAVQVFHKMAKRNKTSFTRYSSNHIDVGTSRTVKLWKMFTIPALLKRTLINMFSWATVNFVYNGLALNVANLTGDIYLNIFINVATEIPGYVLCMVLLNRVGRKKLYMGFMITAGIIGIAAIFPVLYASQDLRWIVTALSALNRLSIAGCFGIIYLLTCELYPTVIRNGAMGTLSTCARIGGIISPYVLKSTSLIPGPIGKSLPMVFMGIVCFISGILVNFLPETNHLDLQENFEEFQEEMKQKRHRKEKVNIPLSIKHTNGNRLS